MRRGMAREIGRPSRTWLVGRRTAPPRPNASNVPADYPLIVADAEGRCYYRLDLRGVRITLAGIWRSRSGSSHRYIVACWLLKQERC